MGQCIMGRIFTSIDETGEKTIRCNNIWCRTKLTQNEIEENGGLCNACAIMETQRRVITQIDRDDHCEGDNDG